MQTTALGKTGFNIVPLVFGGNVFGWTIDEKTSFAILDAFVDAGFNAIDTADVYSAWAPNNKGGESETIIGRWLKARPGRRDKLKLFTKVGSDMGQPGHKGLSARWIAQAVEDSLKRLQTDYIDLYFSHWPDPEVDYAETLGTYDKLLNAGKIRAIGASNLNAEQLQTSLDVAKAQQLPAYQVLQPEYNLYDRGSFEGALQELCVREHIGVVTYFSLASGFLSGKYRGDTDLSKSAGGSRVSKYLNAKGMRILAALDEVSAQHHVKPAEVALAWLIAAKGVTAPIASATQVSHINSFAKAMELQLSPTELAKLTEAGN
ncbi:aldo/keto reductase [Shewanella fodinae]|uniref:aldo/keto reductase n=1 Tax=Shewanella fodinae TaxID=552357 RepID=UPI0016772406|nr:aldo/keto reductase [Shewanella fodinae]MCL2905098.1 aldo/keto reductase [Shewanella fodinae]GGY88623.1 NADP-dependent aryl-alcohol dehydrogenase [Shewanella fodinae]